ncbi:MAG: sporulation protein YqfD [Bacilli bacterium]|jgi:similar to stage IV sporulation protein
MNNFFFNLISDIIQLKIKDRHFEHFLSVLYKHNIPLIKVQIPKKKVFFIKIYEKDLIKIEKLLGLRGVEVVDYHGKLRLKRWFLKHRLFLFLVFCGYLFLLVLTNIIFEIEVIHSQAEIRNLINQELFINNLKKGSLKPNYKQLEKIEKKILSKHKDKIEWLEIIERGTKYIIRVEERKIITKEEEYIYQDIIASKDALILEVEAEQGEIVKEKNDYVKKGEIVIRGTIEQGGRITDFISAKGRIYGEVWYNINVEFPLRQIEEIETSKRKTVYSLKFLRFRWPFFDFKPFKYKRVEEKILLIHRLIPFKIVKEKHYQIKRTDSFYDEASALIKALELVNQKMKSNLKDDESIISSQLLNQFKDEEKIYLKMFFKVYENITAYQEISLIKEE